jgi:hypothetical protein
MIMPVIGFGVEAHDPFGDIDSNQLFVFNLLAITRLNSS